jgi:hypothetical protein
MPGCCALVSHKLFGGSLKTLLNLFIFLLTYVSVHALVKNLDAEGYLNLDFTPTDLADTVLLSDGLLDSETI